MSRGVRALAKVAQASQDRHEAGHTPRDGVAAGLRNRFERGQVFSFSFSLSLSLSLSLSRPSLAAVRSCVGARSRTVRMNRVMRRLVCLALADGVAALVGVPAVSEALALHSRSGSIWFSGGGSWPSGASSRA